MSKSFIPVKVFALGGLGEVGKNTYCIESENTLIMIDAGVKFPEADLPGINYVIPDYSYLIHNKQKVKALFITHGHEDHIGGIPFLIRIVNIPIIYAPKLACALIRSKLENMRVREPITLIEYDENSHIKAGEFDVSFFRVTHSIPDAFGICVDTPEGRIVTTGDFKIDLTPVGKDIELDKISKLGREGVDLLLQDSTNAEIEGYTPSERNVLKSIEELFENARGRLIISTFSSNISRIQQIVTCAINKNRKLCVVGRSMENVIATARGFGYIKIPDASLVPVENIYSYRQNEICILCTGSQGEAMAALSRIANGEHKNIRILPGDTVVFSSSPIPGNGAMIDKLVNKLVRKGAEVITNGVLFALHSSGHPSRQELRLMIKLFNPKYFMPVHGEYRMLKLHGELANTLGIPNENIFLCSNGEIVELLDHKARKNELTKVNTDAIYIDGNDINGLSTAVIKDRKILKENGLISVAISLDSKNSKLLAKPTVVTAGFLLPDKENFISTLEEDLFNKINENLANKATFNSIKTVTKTYVTEYVYKHTRRTPMSSKCNHPMQ